MHLLDSWTRIFTNCGSGYNNPSSVKRSWNYVVSCATKLRVTYSALVDDNARTADFFEL